MVRKKNSKGSPRNSPRLKPGNVPKNGKSPRTTPVITSKKSPRLNGKSPAFSSKSPRFASQSPHESPSLNSFDLFLLDDVDELELNDGEDENNLQVGYCFDERMATFHPAPKYHPECPERILRIYDYLEETDTISQMQYIQITRAKKEEISYCHETCVARNIWNYEHKASKHGIEHIDDDTYFSKKSAVAATLSCGAVVSLTREVLSGNIKSGVAICRPPGHHCECSKQMGFCHINNVCVAAEVAIREFGLKRVLIFDWDVHHGNGTQDIFWERDDVMYMSIHRHDRGRFYPATPAGYEFQIGHDRGRGFNINLPLDGTGHGDYHYAEAMDKLFLPIARQYNPELILISAGFDCARGDPLGEQDVTERGFSLMTSQFLYVCPNVVVALEGGYNLKVIPKMYHAVATTLIEEPKLKSRDVRENCVKEVIEKSKGEEFRIRTKTFYRNLKSSIKSLSENWHLDPDLDLKTLETRLRKMSVRLAAQANIEIEDDEQSSCVVS